MRDVVAKRLFLNPRPNNFNILKAKKKKNHASVYMPRWFFLKSHSLTEFFPVNILEPVEYNKYKLLELLFCDWQRKFENGFWGLKKRNLQTYGVVMAWCNGMTSGIFLQKAIILKAGKTEYKSILK